MSNPISKTFTAYQPITGSIAGYSITLYGLEIIAQNLFISEGQITIEFGEPSKPATVKVPETLTKPFVQFVAPVTGYGASGPLISDFSVGLGWQSVQLQGDGIHYTTINSFYDRGQEMYNLGVKALESLDFGELSKLAGGAKLPTSIKDWQAWPHLDKPTVSLSPNPLTKKQAIIDAKLPQFFTVLAFSALKKQYFLAFKLQYSSEGMVAFVEFIEWQTFPKGAPKVLKKFNVTELLPEGLPYHYITYWFDYYEAGDKTPLYHVNASLPDEYHITLIPGYTNSKTHMVFNVGVKQTQGDNTLVPMLCSFGMLPVDKASSSKPSHTT